MTSKLTLDQFKKRFAAIRAVGYVPSVRRGPTGIGQTLEQMLGLKENNVAVPDWGEIELKAHRIGSSSMITLFTFNRQVWRMKPLDAIRAYGTPDAIGRLGMYFTMSERPNTQGLYLHIEAETISVRDRSETVIAEWQLETLAERFLHKFPALILISAASRVQNDVEWFHYQNARWLTGTSAERIREQIAKGNVLLDLRLHDNTTRARNHGSGFRVVEDKLPLLFEQQEKL